MYTVTISDDGMFTAEYNQPPALSVPLGISGSTIEARINEDRTFSVMIDGEWVVVTADTQVTAANGNVYGVQFVDGIPMPVYTGHSQPVMLGELGGEVTLTRAEDMTWWLGETEVKDGYVHTAANGNMYVLMMDAEGMWSAMYQKVMATLALGTQGSITLVRAEDMSWWYGSEEVGVGSEVMSDNGNTYTLWYTDGVWSARFEPVSMEIAGTGLTAMSREADDMYDVNGTTLPASGVGDITVDGAMYHVWMDDGMLAGARFDDKFKDGRYNIAVGNAALSAQDDAGLLAALGIDEEKTVANELNTHLKVRGEYFSLGTLLGTGMATRAGDNQSTIVSNALDEIRDLRQRAVATLDVFPDASDASARSSALTTLWTKVGTQVGNIFGDKVSLPRARGDDRILDDFDDIIAALSDADAFEAATASGGGGVFAGAKLSADAAASAFTAEAVEASATFGVVGNTRFGAFWKKERDDATMKLNDPAANALGAFAYGTTGTLKTLRTRHVRQGTGNAFYAGRTEAVDGKGNFFSGDIEIQVRFAAERVNAVITNLAGATGAWEYLYGNTDVAEIILPDTRLAGNASWTGNGNDATVVYSTRAGVPRPIDASYTFAGQLLGRDSGNQGNEAVGVWSLGNSADDGANYLAGGFGAMRGADLPDIRPEPDAGEGSQTMILTNKDILRDPTAAEVTAAGTRTVDGDDVVDRTTLAGTAGIDVFWDTDSPDTRGQAIADGMLTVTGRQYGADGNAIVDVDDTTKTPALSVNHLVNDAKYRTHKIDLAAALDGGTTWANGDKHVDIAKAAIEKQLRILESDIGLSDSVKEAAWMAVQNAILNNLFGDAAFTASKGGDFMDDYNASRNDDFVRAAAEALEALQNNNALKAALGDGGVFKGLAKANGKSNQAGADTVNLFDRRISRVQYAIGSTDFTRFGAWRRQTSANAEANYVDRTEDAEGDGPNSLAYSQLGKTSYQGLSDPRYPNGARMTYEGSTIAVVGDAFFEGAVDIEVLWDSGAGVDGTPGNADDVISATLNMSMSGFENMADASPLYLDTATGTNTNDAANALEEVVSIGISNVDVNEMLAVSANATNSVVTVNSVRANQVAAQPTTLVAGGSVTTDMVDGQFVGLGVGGPLAVLGTWEMDNNGTSGGTAAIGAKVTVANDDGDITHVSVTGASGDTLDTFNAVRIHGGFGAELP